MPEIRLVKKYPHIKDEDVTSIFQEGYIKGFENGRKGAIPIEWLHSIMKKQLIFAMNSEMEGTTTVQDGVIHCVSGAIACQVLANVIGLWEKENVMDKQIEQWEFDDDMDWQTIQREQGNEQEDRT